MTGKTLEITRGITNVPALLHWQRERRIAGALRCRRAPLTRLQDWCFGDDLRHRTGRFFSIAGLRQTAGDMPLPEQPIIKQPEIGILGFLLRRDEADHLQILVQAKTEPGNVDELQMAPTVQATESNYLQVHRGRPTPYLEYFLDANIPKAADCLQSEQGTRFWGKYNRNMAVILPAAVAPEPVSEWWCWVDLEVFLRALNVDYLVNTDSRSSLVCLPWEHLCPGRSPFSRLPDPAGFGRALRRSSESPCSAEGLDLADVLGFLERFRKRCRFEVEEVPLGQLRDWRLDDGECCDAASRRFSVRGYHVEVNGREVPCWDQPLVHSFGLGRAVLLCQKRDGVLHFLLRCSCEIGFREMAQFGPSIQVYGAGEPPPESLAAFVMAGTGLKRHAEYRQSDEGGRFHHSVTWYQLLEVDPAVPVPVNHDSDLWVTLRQFRAMLASRGLLSNELRSVASLLLPYV